MAAMRTIFRIWALVGTLLLVGGLGSAQAAKAGFAEFEGTFKGKPTGIVYSSLSMTATVNIAVKVPKSGKQAVVTVTGFVVYSGSTFPLSGTMVFTRNTVTVSDVLFNLLAAPGPGSGSVALNKRGTALTYNVVYPPEPTIPMSGAMKVNPQGKKKKKLTLTFNIAAGSTVYNFVFEGTAKVKPEK
jgi:hypothetical protein